MSFLEIAGVSKRLDEDHLALNEIDLSVKMKTKVGVAGETGSGKSTLLKTIGGLLKPDEGAVLFESNVVYGPLDRLIPGCPGIAYLSQHFELPKFITVLEYLHDPYQISEQEAEEIYQACQIVHLLPKQTRELSGGERQRVALAKLLTLRPKLMLLDEPFSNLDVLHKKAMLRVLENISEDFEVSMLLVSHDPMDLLGWAERILVMKSGKIVQDAEPQIIYNQPKDEYVAGLFGSYNLVALKNWGTAMKNGFTSVKSQVIVRPEFFGMEKEQTPNTNDGQVEHVSYRGAYDELTVLTTNERLNLRSEVGKYKKGQQVRVSLVLHS